MKTGRIKADGKAQASNALFGLSAIYLLPGLFTWSIRGVIFDANDIVAISGFIALVVLAIWARWSPRFPAIIAGGLTFAFVALQLPGISRWNAVMWVINLAMVGLVAIAVAAAWRREPVAPVSEQP
jgi:hypothetical protein